MKNIIKNLLRLEKSLPFNIEKFKSSLIGKKYFVLGLVIGLIPYVVHIQGWLR